MKNECLIAKGFYMMIDMSTVLKLLGLIFFLVKQNSVNITFYSDKSTIGTQMSKCFKPI